MSPIRTTLAWKTATTRTTTTTTTFSLTTTRDYQGRHLPHLQPSVLSPRPHCIVRFISTQRNPWSIPRRTVLARLRVTRPLHHHSSGCSDRARASGHPRPAPISRLLPVSLISRVLDLVTPYALRNLFGLFPTPLGSSCISSRHPRPNRLFRCSHPTRLRPKPGLIFRLLGARSSTKFDCIQDIGSLAFTSLPPWSRPCGLTSDRALRSDRTASSSLTTALRGFFHPSSGPLPTWWKIVPCLSHDLRPTPADSAGRSIPAFQPIRSSKRQRGGRRGVPSLDEYLLGCK